MKRFEIHSITSKDSEWLENLLCHCWGSPLVLSRGRLYHADKLPGFIAANQDERIGLVTYSINGPECEIVTLNSIREYQGVGTALLTAVESAARTAGCRFLRLITTNDNLHALEFYQKRGFVLRALYRDAVIKSRALKSEIPVRGNNGIPIRDEIELEFILEV